MSTGLDNGALMDQHSGEPSSCVEPNVTIQPQNTQILQQSQEVGENVELNSGSGSVETNDFGNSENALSNARSFQESISINRPYINEGMTALEIENQEQFIDVLLFLPF